MPPRPRTGTAHSIAARIARIRIRIRTAHPPRALRTRASRSTAYRAHGTAPRGPCMAPRTGRTRTPARSARTAYRAHGTAPRGPCMAPRTGRTRTPARSARTAYRARRAWRPYRATYRAHSHSSARCARTAPTRGGQRAPTARVACVASTPR